MNPKVLEELKEDLKKNKLIATENVNGEGRVASLVDEENIINFLTTHPKWGKYVSDVRARGFGDFILDYEGVKYVINIKSTTGTTDNATSKIGFLWAFTDIDYDELPKSISIGDWFNLMNERKCEDNNRDYFYLTFDKNDMSNIFIRGSKQIINWKANPSNLLQIAWKKEWETDYPNFSFDQSFENVVGGIKESVKKKLTSYPDEWIEEYLLEK